MVLRTRATGWKASFPKLELRERVRKHFAPGGGVACPNSRPRRPRPLRLLLQLPRLLRWTPRHQRPCGSSYGAIQPSSAAKGSHEEDVPQMLRRGVPGGREVAAVQSLQTSRRRRKYGPRCSQGAQLIRFSKRGARLRVLLTTPNPETPLYRDTSDGGYPSGAPIRRFVHVFRSLRVRNHSAELRPRRCSRGGATMLEYCGAGPPPPGGGRDSATGTSPVIGAC